MRFILLILILTMPSVWASQSAPSCRIPRLKWNLDYTQFRKIEIYLLDRIKPYKDRSESHINSDSEEGRQKITERQAQNPKFKAELFEISNQLNCENPILDSLLAEYTVSGSRPRIRVAITNTHTETKQEKRSGSFYTESSTRNHYTLMIQHPMAADSDWISIAEGSSLNGQDGKTPLFRIPEHDLKATESIRNALKSQSLKYDPSTRVFEKELIRYNGTQQEPETAI